MAPADSSSSLSGPVPGFGAAPSLDVPPPAAPSFTPNSATDSQTDDFDEKLLLGFPENRGKRKANRYVHDRKRLAKWDRRYIELAAHVGSWSKDPNAKVGCVIVSPTFGRAVTFSFNGFPANVADNEERLTGKKSELGRILHAEQNALLYAVSLRPFAAARFQTSGRCPTGLGSCADGGAGPRARHDEARDALQRRGTAMQLRARWKQTMSQIAGWQFPIRLTLGLGSSAMHGTAIAI